MKRARDEYEGRNSPHESTQCQETGSSSRLGPSPECTLASTSSISRKARRCSLIALASTASVSSRVLQKVIETMPASCGSLDERLAVLLLHLVEAEKALTTPESRPGSRSRVRFSTFDYSVVNPPSPSDPSASVRPLDDLVQRLGQVIDSAADLRAVVYETPHANDIVLHKQIRFVLESLSRIASPAPTTACDHEQRMAAHFLREEIMALVYGSCSSQIEGRRSDLLLSLIRFALKEIINQGRVSLDPTTGNMEQNYEDPAALFHHALKMVALMISEDQLEVSESPSPDPQTMKT
jgi:hypothetical protein